MPFIGEVITGLGQPTAVAIQGDYVAIPDLMGWLTVLDKENKIVAVLGKNKNAKLGRSYGVKQENWVEGQFSGTHGSYWDKDGNLYVQDWNRWGRVNRLTRLR